MSGYHSEYEMLLKCAKVDLDIEIESFIKEFHKSIEEESKDKLMKAINIYTEKIRKAVNAYEAEKLKAKEKASGIFENSNKTGGLN